MQAGMDMNCLMKLIGCIRLKERINLPVQKILLKNKAAILLLLFWQTLS